MIDATDRAPILGAICSLRATREFTADPVNAGDLRTVLMAATMAPSGTNRQPWRFVVLVDADHIRRFGELYEQVWWAKRGDAGIRSENDIAADDSVMRSALALSRAMRTVPCVVLACSTDDVPASRDAVVGACQNLLLAAAERGLGGTITTLHPSVDNHVRAWLRIPDTARIVYAIPLGHPAMPLWPPRRKPIDEVAAVGAWDGPPLVDAPTTTPRAVPNDNEEWAPEWTIDSAIQRMRSVTADGPPVPRYRPTDI